jgi:endonuclease/exonuclease/phosphatase (EEP) superfamily protein YafD
MALPSQGSHPASGVTSTLDRGYARPPDWVWMPVVARLVLRTVRLVYLALSWVVVAGLLIVSGFHLVKSEPRSAIVGAIAVTPWLYMLSWVTLSTGLFTRRRFLAFFSIVLVCLQLWWALPDFNPISHLHSPPPGSVTLRLFDANVSQSNRNLDEIGAEVRRDNPDVVTMEELTPTALRSLRSTDVMGRYRYSLVLPSYGPYGMALWSVFPLVDATEWFAYGQPELRAWIELPGGARLRIDVLHTIAPYLGPDEPTIWEKQMGAIRAELAAEPRPLVAVGDLNATWYDWHFHDLLGLGLSDAAVVAGQGWRMTWPRDQQPVVPYLRIDHVLLSKGISLQSYALGNGNGSDHHPMLVTFSVLARGFGSRLVRALGTTRAPPLRS